VKRKRRLVDAAKHRRRRSDLIVFQTRLLHKVDSMLRRKIRKHGDMSAFVRQSLEEADLRSIELVRPAAPKRGSPDLIEQIRLSLAQIESKKTDPNPSKKPRCKVPTLVKRKPQKLRA
jgi:hypothetical protein